MPNKAFQTFKVSLVGGTAELAERHCHMSNIEPTQCNQLLHGSSNRLEFLDFTKPKFRQITKFEFVILAHRCVCLLRRSAKHHLEATTGALRRGLCSMAECAILVAEEISTKMMTRFLNILQIAVPWVRLQFLVKFIGIQQSHECAIHAQLRLMILGIKKVEPGSGSHFCDWKKVEPGSGTHF